MKIDHQASVPAASPPSHPAPLARDASCTAVAWVPARKILGTTTTEQAIALPINRDSERAAAYLAAQHEAGRDGVRQIFGSTEAVPRERRFLVSTVSVPESAFLGDYLDVPEENILKLDVRGLASKPGPYERRSARRKVVEAAEAFFDGRYDQVASLTVLGHMTYHHNTPYLGRLSASSLSWLLRDIEPTHLNFFSCHSEDIATEVLQNFVGHGHPVQHSVCFSGEVSPYPPVRKGLRPLRFFYGGPEIGPTATILRVEQHTPILDHALIASMRASSHSSEATQAATYTVGSLTPAPTNP